MTAWPAPLHQDSNQLPTSSEWSASLGTWVFPVRIVSSTAGAGGVTQLEDAVHASGDAGVMMLAVRQDTIAALAANGDYIPLTTDLLGRLRITGTQLEDAVAASGDQGHFMLAIRSDTAVSDAAAGDYHGLHVDSGGRLHVSSPGIIPGIPVGATPLTAASGNVSNASAAATLAAASSVTTYITGFEVTAGGATAAALVAVTVTGTITGTLTYIFGVPAGAAVIATPLVVPFPVPIPASATNTAIVVTCPALGTGNTNAAVVAHGFRV